MDATHTKGTTMVSRLIKFIRKLFTKPTTATCRCGTTTAYGHRCQDCGQLRLVGGKNIVPKVQVKFDDIFEV